jgi:hypothetical protein
VYFLIGPYKTINWSRKYLMHNLMAQHGTAETSEFFVGDYVSKEIILYGTIRGLTTVGLIKFNLIDSNAEMPTRANPKGTLRD